MEIKKEQQKIAVLLGSGSLPLHFEIFLIYEKILVQTWYHLFNYYVMNIVIQSYYLTLKFHLINGQLKLYFKMSLEFHISCLLSNTEYNTHYRLWSWSYGTCRWICNNLYNQYLSPLKLWFQIPLVARCNWYNFMWSGLSVTCGRVSFLHVLRFPSLIKLTIVI